MKLQSGGIGTFLYYALAVAFGSLLIPTFTRIGLLPGNPYNIIDATEEKPSKGQAMVVIESKGKPQEGSYTIAYNTAPQFSVYPDDVKLDTGMLLLIYDIKGDSIFTQIADQ